MSNEKQYNGWTNYETWCVKLWMDNDESGYDYWESTAQEILDESEAESWQTREQAATNELAARLKSEHEEAAPELGASVWADLLGASLSEVNWYEIAEALLDDKTPSDAEEDEEAEATS